MKQMKKPTYFINGFQFIYDCFTRADKSTDYTFLFPESSRYDFLTNYLLLKSWIRKRKLDTFDVLHFNNWENILQYDPNTKKNGQVTIAEAHGYFVGVNFQSTLKELPIQKRIPNWVLKILWDKKMQRKLLDYDMFYCSTPNMLEHCEKIREDAKWLPNPIETDIFNDKREKIFLEGEPSVFLPTRLHAFKNPLFGVRIFQEIKKAYPKAKLHMIHYGIGADPLFGAFRRIMNPEEVIYHKRMPRTELAKYYRSADLVLGQFNENLGNLSLVELEAMACGAPIVTLDKYELKKNFGNQDKLNDLAFKLIEDRKFRNTFINRNRKYVIDVHSEKAVVKLNHKYIGSL